jgi:hypothetical protein
MNCLTVFGLVFDLLGVAILFVWPPPAEPMFKDGSDMLTFTTDEDRTKNKRLWGSQRRNARIGLTFVFVGFGLQLAAQFWGNPLSHVPVEGCTVV